MAVLHEARDTTSAAALKARIEAAGAICEIACAPGELTAICTRLTDELGCVFATLVVEDTVDAVGRPIWSLRYFFYRDSGLPWLCVELRTDARNPVVPSISGLATGPSVDWHEREVEDLFRIIFEGHPRLGEFILHEDWPEGVAPMRRAFDPRRRLVARQTDPRWQPPSSRRRAPFRCRSVRSSPILPSRRTSFWRRSART
jgi:formate hydrogenlyase subunit 5